MNDFDALKIMSDRNLEIAAAVDILEVKKDKRGGKVTMGVDATRFGQLANSLASGDGKYVAILYVVNMEQFNQIKGEVPETVSI